MKKILIFLIMFFLLTSCVSDVKTGIPLKSISIKMSKKNNVIVSIYHANTTQITNKSSTIKIIEVWSENSWCYKDTDMNIEKLKDINLIITFNKEGEELNSLNCRRVDEEFSGIGTTNNKIFIPLTNPEQVKDTLVFLFQSDKGKIPVTFTKID